ncbi:FAD-dependent oxidoreductase [Urbifossiella limnaea]|uniref:6'''-hydroxyparomomycin C oxidase n=1 Tax=Urbifossiella limnaea TaxID=2528023 RepID=A0A517Y1X9_9BACT|nr:GMC family oxidoreductase [Urbifossiella limnaea]QDU23718.1 6'''-hydroxyparomomycin C oxidase [Urbifossiella limnaea]
MVAANRPPRTSLAVVPGAPPVSRDCDVLVIGSGAGGATFAYACARAGKSVVLVERGRPAPPADADEKATLIDKAPYDDRTVEVNGALKRLYMGGVPGGGTALFGGALLRPSRDDFHPGRHYGHRLGREVWDWPVGYDDLAPHYAEAERLFGVAGSGDEDYGPLPRPAAYPHEPLPLHPVNERLMTAARRRGLKPFRLPLAIDPTKCLRCGACAGYVCPTGARGSALHLIDRASADGLPLRVLTGVEVEALDRDGGGRVTGVRLRDRATGRESVVRARRYAVAAGAIHSPALLLRSGMTGEHVGRHYMPHLSPITVGLFRTPTEAEDTFVKQVGFTDFYFGTRKTPHKMGLVSSLPVPGPHMTAKMTPRFLPRKLVHFLRRRMLPMAGIVEDLPDPANRVTLGADGRPRLRHRFGAYDLYRGKRLGREMARILKQAGAVVAVRKLFASDEHVAHQCGTLRFGADPAHAVLDRDCRVFGHPNVFVVDGSFMPTSLGVGPALTIVANALRVAGVAAAEL